MSLQSPSKVIKRPKSKEEKKNKKMKFENNLNEGTLNFFFNQNFILTA